MKDALGVIYLARATEGLDAFRRFAESYTSHPAGTEHDLVVIYKGFTSNEDLNAARRLFSGISQLGIELDDSGFDIGSYLLAAERLAHRHLVFLNTHSTIEQAHWLCHLYRHGRSDGCGIAGAMGSYESLYNSISYLEAVIFAAAEATGRQAEQLARHFDFLLPRFRPDWYKPAQKNGLLTRFLAQAANIASRRRQRDRLRRFGSLRGSALIWPGAPEFDIQDFPQFPNPHVRSNGFLVRREHFLTLRDIDFKSKQDANLFESGRNSITAKFRRAGLAAILVGANGDAFQIEDWPSSRTFRLDDQSNLLIADNHTRAFAAMSEGSKSAHTLMTWGEYAGEFPNLPKLGFQFRKGASAPAQNHERSIRANSFADPAKHTQADDREVH
ncbi:hypothetical protein [Bradyrhizobium sp. SZCCHNS1054]|uniref:hypothetical protein n=1 Tax=Bradyrhizobium sp. SZCCHNS1054 TaxID=3057301 RepID=UPI002916598B|nr:hypothetical protein [Bradyrhizobium sp. SZCCHNS1054]